MDKDAEKFLDRVAMVRRWFNDEELEVSDYVVGRMASRINTLLSQAIEEAVKEKEIACIESVRFRIKLGANHGYNAGEIISDVLEAGENRLDQLQQKEEGK